MKIKFCRYFSIKKFVKSFFFFLICINLTNCIPMKKLFYLFAFFTVVLSSCTSEDENQNQGHLLKKMVYRGANVSLSYKDYNFNFNYDDNDRLLSIDRDGAVFREYIYSNDLITQVKYYVFWNGESQSTLECFYDFEYDSMDRLIRVIRHNGSGNIGDEYNFDYVDLNHANYRIYLYSWPGDNDLYLSGTITFDDITKNILSATQLSYANYLNQDGSVQVSSIYKVEHNYDDKKHPCFNIKGFKELAFFNLLNIDSTIFTENFGVTNNLISVKQYPINDPNNIIYPAWSYDYGDTFPSKSKKETNSDFNVYFYY